MEQDLTVRGLERQSALEEPLDPCLQLGGASHRPANDRQLHPSSLIDANEPGLISLTLHLHARDRGTPHPVRCHYNIEIALGRLGWK